MADFINNPKVSNNNCSFWEKTKKNVKDVGKIILTLSLIHNKDIKYPNENKFVRVFNNSIE